MHSLVTRLWDEWLALEPEGEYEETASWETAGLISGFRAAASEAEDTVELGTTRLWVMRRLLKLWKASRWGPRLNLAGRMRVPGNMKGRVRLVLPRELYEDIVTPPPPLSWQWDWLRGIWGGCGAVYVPRSGYYLALRIREPAEEVLLRVKRTLRKGRISCGERTVRDTRELILRAQEEIVTFLSKIGLTGVSLLIEDKAILRAMRDQANRIRNCDTANIQKSLKASSKQTDLALRLRNDGLLPTLSAPFRELVLTRLEHPEASLSELGGLLSPPVTKSTVKYRWECLRKLAGETE